MGISPEHDSRRRIPPVDRLLSDPAVGELIGLYGRDEVRVQVRFELGRLRGELETSGEGLEATLAALPERLRLGLETRLGHPLRRILNATGIFLHTNLGRAPLPAAVARRLPELLDAYCDLELDLETGRRGDRNHRVEAPLRALTGGEAALVVNNNAAAMVLVLSALASGREVVVSRGELVEIGGSFRIPDLLTAAGSRLVEVGTTNRTRLDDYAAAVHDATALILKVFPSNYRITGFTSSVAPAELAALARSRGVPLLVDEGSGLLRPHRAPQLASHPSFEELLGQGCDLVCGSGDKLLGGPQAGLLVGRRDLVAICRRHPFYRALRPDRAALATLELVFRAHLSGAAQPLDRLWPDAAEHHHRLETIAAALDPALEVRVVSANAFIGGGSAPEQPVPGEALALRGSEELQRRLRLGSPPVVGYLREGRLILDLRTVDPGDDEALLAALRAAAEP